MADDWDLNTFYWPKDRVLRWWAQGWDWDSLQTKPCPYPRPEYKTYGEYYGEAYWNMVDFTNPHPRSNAFERDYWGKRWLTTFAGKRWTPYHLPLYDPNTLELSPKHPDYSGNDKWSHKDHLEYINGIRLRIKNGGKYGAPLNAIIFTFKKQHPDTDLIINNLIITEYDNCVDFSGAMFCGSFLFGINQKNKRATFSNGSSFSEASFANDVDFTKFEFQNAIFDNAWFGGTVKFIDVFFNDFSKFSNIQFMNGVDFSHSTFNDKVYFSGTKFNINSNFLCTQFKDYTYFSSSEFGGNVNFKCIESETRDRVDVSNLPNIDFSNTLFRGDVDFSGRRFTGKTDFRGAEFHGLAKFYGAELSEETYFTFEDDHWPLPPKPKGRIAKVGEWVCRLLCGCAGKACGCVTETPASEERFEEYEKAFCRLKLIQQGQQARPAEQFFYKMELKSRMRRADVPWQEKAAAWFYATFSDYGEKFWWPLCWLGGFFVFATGAAYVAALPFAGEFSPNNLDFAATAAWHNLVPGGFIKDVFQACHDEACRSYRYGEWSDRLLSAYGFRLYFFAGLHAAINLGLWFLFALALKRRFQIK